MHINDHSLLGIICINLKEHFEADDDQVNMLQALVVKIIYSMNNVLLVHPQRAANVSDYRECSGTLYLGST